jgi:ADP-ribose pyrophosphatase
MNKVPKTLASNSIYKNRYVEVKVDKVEFEGKQWEQVYFTKPNKDAVLVLPLENDGINLIQIYRYPTQQFLWQLPAGGIEPGNSELDTAKAELKEEAGLTADKFTKIGSVIAEPGMSPQEAFIYVAEGLHRGEQHLSDTEIGMKLKFFTFKEVKEMIKNHEIKCGFTLSALMVLKNNYLDY